MFTNRLVLTHTILSLFIGQCIFWIIFLQYEELPPEIPFWFLRPWGEQQLAVRELIWLFPGISIGLLALNLLFTTYLTRRQPFLVSLLMATSTFSSTFLLFSTLHVLNRIFAWI